MEGLQPGDASRRLAGKVALVSGAARGMGASHARALVAHGAKVLLGDVLDVEGEQLAAELGEGSHYVHLDVTEPGDWKQAVTRALERFGRLNVLVNNAGIVSAAPIGEYTREQWDGIISVNLSGVFHGMTAAVEALKDGAPSSIVNISSTAGLKRFAGLAGYTATKFGVRGLTKAAALELGGYGIRVNSVHPGSVATAMTAGMELSQTQVALHRVGRPEEISLLVVYLASDESSFCTGSEFVADGGDTAGRAAIEGL